MIWNKYNICLSMIWNQWGIDSELSINDFFANKSAALFP